MKNAVAICGAICSGKSSVIGYLADTYGWNKISFGDYVRYIAATKHLPPTRETYQTLGQELFANRGADKFLEDVVKFNAPLSTTHLFDGIRHTLVVDALRQAYEKSFVVFLAISDHERYLRFKMRIAPGDPILSYDKFLELSSQPIEQGIAAISEIAELCVDASVPFQEIIARIEQELAVKRFFVES